MDEDRRSPWMRITLLAGVAYALVGITFAWPTTHVGGWRFAAWAVSGCVFAAHIAYECLWLRNTVVSGAWHVALGVAMGSFGLAMGANLHSLGVPSTSRHRRLLLVSLALWPIITAVPAFVTALAAAAVLTRIRASTAR